MADRLSLAVATLGVGYAPKAPGTFGALVAMLAYPWLFAPLPHLWRAALLGGIFLLGGMAASRVERISGSEDPGLVVVDEVLGQWVTYLPFAELLPWQMLAGFALFRLFDIAKPWPVCASEHCLGGGFGVMIDDVVAGLYACLSLWLLMRAEAFFFL